MVELFSCAVGVLEPGIAVAVLVDRCATNSDACVGGGRKYQQVRKLSLLGRSVAATMNNSAARRQLVLDSVLWTNKEARVHPRDGCTFLCLLKDLARK